MTAFSSRGIVRSDKTADIQEFTLPVQAYPQPEDDENRGEECIQPKPPAETITGEWSPVGVKEGVLNESDEILEGVRREAEQRIQESKKMTEDILNATREQMEHIMSIATDDGYRSRYEEGFKTRADKTVEERGKTMADQRETFRQGMKRALASIEEAKEQRLRTYLEKLKDCPMAVTEKVIHISLKSSRGIIKRMAMSETERPKKTIWVKIYMEETEYEMMMQADAGIIGGLSKLSDNIKFIVMDKKDSGNRTIGVSEKTIDISVDTQLENIKEILQNIRVQERYV